MNLEACKEPNDSQLGRALVNLRKCWWHDGTDDDRAKVKSAAKALKRELKKVTS